MLPEICDTGKETFIRGLTYRGEGWGRVREGQVHPETKGDTRTWARVRKTLSECVRGRILPRRDRSGPSQRYRGDSVVSGPQPP